MDGQKELDALLSSMEQDRSLDAALPFTRIAADYFSNSGAATRPVTTHLSAEALATSLPPLPAEPQSPGAVSAALEQLVEQSIWLNHPRYMGHQVSAPAPATVWSESVIGALNQSVAIREMSPGVTAIEHELVRWFADRIGLPVTAGGTFTSGGTEASFTALLAARAAALPRAWTEGVGAHELPVLLCSEHAHYAITRAAAQLGLGVRRALAIPVDAEFRMDVRALEQKLHELERAGTKVMAVVATAGSTPTGSFDDLEAIASLCAARGIWLHVDGAHGMTAVLSPTRAHLVRGAERARTVAWDPHKTMLMPLGTGLLLARDERDLEAAFTQDAPYIFHATQGRRWDQGPRSFLCSRRADALKVWVAMQRYGTRAFGLLFDHLSDLTLELHARLLAHPNFEPLHRPDCNIICFRYLPAGVSEPSTIDEVNRRLRSDYNEHGTGWITTTLLSGKRVLRVTMMNPRTRTSHLDELLDELHERGSRIAVSLG